MANSLLELVMCFLDRLPVRDEKAMTIPIAVKDLCEPAGMLRISTRGLEIQLSDQKSISFQSPIIQIELEKAICIFDLIPGHMEDLTYLEEGLWKRENRTLRKLAHSLSDATKS